MPTSTTWVSSRIGAAGAVVSMLVLWATLAGGWPPLFVLCGSMVLAGAATAIVLHVRQAWTPPSLRRAEEMPRPRATLFRETQPALDRHLRAIVIASCGLAFVAATAADIDNDGSLLRFGALTTALIGALAVTRRELVVRVTDDAVEVGVSPWARRVVPLTSVRSCALRDHWDGRSTLYALGAHVDEQLVELALASGEVLAIGTRQAAALAEAVCTAATSAGVNARSDAAHWY